MKLKIKDFGLSFCILIFGFWILSSFTGCAQRSDLQEAQNYAQQSEGYYQQAADKYKNLIVKGNNLEKLHLGLGLLYYSHGDFSRAAEEFKKTSQPQAKKFLAVSYYRLGEFTDALEIFNREKIDDDEYFYYYGLTCEKLNLFDQALSIYRKIKGREFLSLASGRIDIIEKETKPGHIKDINLKVSEILERAPSLEKYPEAGALILYCDEKVEVTDANTETTSLYYVIKILNERGKEGFSETHIDYDSTFEKVELEYARTIKPDGTVVEVGSRHIRDVSKYLNFPLYSNARVYIISFPEITAGAVIEYKAKIYQSQLVNKKDFILVYPLQASEPVIQANLTIELPENKTLHIKNLNEEYNNFGANLMPEKKEINGRLIYSWQFKDIPQIIPEPNMPPNSEINPAMLFSTFSGWQEVYDWWWALAKDKIKADSAIKDKVRELIKDKTSDEAKVSAIYNFCAQQIRYVAVEYGQAGYEPHQASDVFGNKYGDCKDQAILLVTMLREANLSAWPLLISTKDYYNLNTDFPAVIFNHSISAVLLGDRLIFLDPTAETCSFGNLPVADQSRRVLVFKDDGYEIQDTPLYSAAHNLIKQSIKIKINSEETLNADKSVFTYGIYEQAQRYWLLYTPPALIEQALREKIQAISIGAVLDKYKIENLQNLNNPVVLSYAFHGDEYFTTAGPLRLMPQLSALDTALVAKDKRKYAIDFDALDIKETVFEIELPSSFSIKYLPENVTEESPWFKVDLAYERQDNKIFFSQKMELKKNTVPQNEYADFKIFFESLAKKIKQRVILEKK